MKSPAFIIPITNKNHQYYRDQQNFAVGSGSQVLRINWDEKSTRAKKCGSIFEIYIDSTSHWTIGSPAPDGKGIKRIKCNLMCNLSNNCLH